MSGGQGSRGVEATRAVVVDADGGFSLIESPAPEMRPGEVRVAVRAISINRGEVLRARAAGAGFRPGWDFAGDVLEAPPGAGLPAGARVAGFIPAGAWASEITVAPRQIAVLPDGVSYEMGAALPVAGLTALGAIDAGGSLVGRRVLVTGATGGVGTFAVHLAALSGASVTAVVRRSADECRNLFPEGTGIVTSADGGCPPDLAGPFDLIIETLGGATLARAMTLLAHDGKCVSLGVTDASATTFDAEAFFMTGNASLEGFVLFRDRKALPREGMERLLRLVARGRLHVPIGRTDSWESIDAVAASLLARAFTGKAVLRLDGGAEG